MPANQSDGPANWREQPLGRAHPKLDLDPDERVFDPDDAVDVATNLLATCDEVMVFYEFPNVDIGALALESAQSIIQKRREIYEQRMQEPRFQALTRRITHVINSAAAFEQTGDLKYKVKPSPISA